MNNLSPKVSVIIPVYNTQKYLRECLDSVCNQTFKDIEIICINDGSTDLSSDILSEYKAKDPRITVINQENQGAFSARNKGIELSCGKYLMFLDSDDIFDLNFISELYEKAEQNNADMVVCSSKKIDNIGNIDENTNPLWPINLYKTPLNRVFSPDDFENDILDMFCVIPWNKIYRSELIKNNNIKFLNTPPFDDIYFGCTTKICAKRIYVFEKKLVYYRYSREDNQTTSRAAKAVNMIKAAIYVKEFLKKQGQEEQFENSFKDFFINRFRSEISYCNDKEYNNFVKSLKELMPTEWKTFEPALKKESVTIKRLNESIGTKKVFLWGASLFLENLLKTQTRINPNILGIIDKNTSLCGKKLGGYEIFSPQILKTQKPDAISLTVFSNNEIIYDSLQKELKENHPDIELLENIFK